MRSITKILGGLAAGSLAVVSVALGGPESTAPEQISDVLCLRKLALDLTHRGPTEEELARIKSGETTLAQMADQYLSSAEFTDVVTTWYRPQFPPTGISPEGVDIFEPSRIAQYIVVNNRDYRELLTGTYTVTPEGTVVDVVDRPAAGVLSTPHYMSAYVGSYRRNWAGHFLKEWTGIQLEAITLPPDVDPNNLDPQNLITDPLCSGCHGSAIYGIDYLAPFSFCYQEDGSYDSTCDESQKAQGKFLTAEGAGLPQLGTIVANSKEFRAQTANLFSWQLFGRQFAKQETDLYVSAARAFVDSGYSAKALVKHLVTSPHYCAR